MFLAQLAARLAGIVLIVCSTAQAGETVRITNGEWPPFTSEHLPGGGSLSRVVWEAFALEDVTVEYGFYPWKRSYEYARAGRWHDSVAWDRPKSRSRIST